MGFPDLVPLHQLVPLLGEPILSSEVLVLRRDRVHATSQLPEAGGQLRLKTTQQLYQVRLSAL
jgi:hypothetical protein